MKLAAIDIGSNAIRLQVTTTITSKGQLHFKKLEYVRFPLRLGQDVFNSGTISAAKKSKFKKLMRAFKILLDLYEVNDYMACATSAMREAKNGADIIKEVQEELDLKIKIIDGVKEALLINNAISSFLDKKKSYIHIDVGGGSTELNLLKGGKKIASRSFKIGSVRRLEHNDSPVIWKNMSKWVKEKVAESKTPVTAVGTGGNINKIFDLAEKAEGDKMSLAKVKEVQKYIRDMTMEERINDLQLNPDRADVIIPASDIYIAVMEWAGAHNIIVPAVGLKDGIMQYLYERNTVKEKIKFS
ncbi:phosphatase [Fulvivirga maritima]|uniref:Ppx/GppA phosphatase family protein n=1 Tax=Fulvivirga maritima TaxID=2904247 RepID=UPI001F329838|nr:phosphatase [Fulvivirga maritima]UII24885.1 phosphatase [Fulvivirga maritima]